MVMSAVVRSILVILVTVIISCVCRCRGQPARCHDDERRALLQIKQSINYPGGTAFSDWSRPADHADCCQWSGITCNNHTGRVVGMFLSSSRTALGDAWHPNFTTFVQFTELERLSFASNRIGGNVPDVLCNLRRLKLLDMGMNWLEGPLPHCLCSMPNLVHLDLSGNRFRGGIPSCLENLHKLEVLYLMANEIDGTLPHGLCNLKRLEELDLGANSLEGTIPDCLCSMHSLRVLGLSDNLLRGKIPMCVGNLHNLERLDLIGVRFEGSIPPSIFSNLTKLTTVSIGGGMEGVFSLSAFANLSNLRRVEIASSYSLEIETESLSWIPSFQLQSLTIFGCVVNNYKFPAGFINRQPRLEYLSLANDLITGPVPLWVLCNSSLAHLDLRDNRFNGTFHLPCRNASRSTVYIDLAHNHVHGSLPADIGISLPSLQHLNMPGNELEGGIPPSLGQSPLTLIDLSDNHLSGNLPQALVKNQTMLRYLNLSYNQLEGAMLPAPDLYMPSIEYLYLQYNKFTGSIPPELSNTSLLRALHVGHNDLECSVSYCLPSFPSMVALSLRENRLDGRLPNSLCQMQHLHILDLFGNNLYGDIPPCLNNISLWKIRHYGTSDDILSWLMDTTDVMQFTSKNSLTSYQGRPLTWMAGLDISSNRLSGAIPWEIGELRGLQFLNLSNNHLKGSLPSSVGNMQSLESLDLSHNNLIGPIPQAMAQLYFLSVFSVAFNNLSGEIPYKSQFSTFSGGSYEGNPGLCGAPLKRNCPTSVVHQKEVEEGPSLLDNNALFYTCVALSFGLGFWGFIASTVFNKGWRIKYYGAIDRFSDYYQRGP